MSDEELRYLSKFLGGCMDAPDLSSEEERGVLDSHSSQDELVFWKMTTGKAIGFDGVTSKDQFNRYMNQTLI